MGEGEVKFESSSDMMSNDSGFEFDEYRYSEIIRLYNQRLDYIFDMLSEQKKSENYKIAEKLKSTFQYIETLINNLRNYNGTIENLQKLNIDEHIAKQISENKGKALKILKESVIQINIFESSLLELEIFLRIVKEPNMETKSTSSSKKNKRNGNVEITQMIDKMNKERGKNIEKARLDIENSRQRNNYSNYIRSGGIEPIGEDERYRLSDWLVNKANNTPALSNDVAQMYIACAALDPDFFLDDVILTLTDNLLYNQKWDKRYLNFLNSLGRNQMELINVINPLKKIYLKNCVLDIIQNSNKKSKSSLYDNELSEIIDELVILGMTDEIIQIEKNLESKSKYVELQDIQIQRLFGEIPIKTIQGLVSIFTIEEDNVFLGGDTNQEKIDGEKSSFIIVFANTKLKEIFLNTPEGRKEAEQKAKEFEKIIVLERDEKEKKAKQRKENIEKEKYNNIKDKMLVIDEQANNSMSHESIQNENNLKGKGEYIKLHDIQIERLFGRIPLRKVLGLSSIFTIEEDNVFLGGNTNQEQIDGEKSSYIIVFVSPELKEIFRNTPEGRRKAEKKAEEYRNIIEPIREQERIAYEKKLKEIEDKRQAVEAERKKLLDKRKKKLELSKFERFKKLFRFK